jgi:hypothetical protein
MWWCRVAWIDLCFNYFTPKKEIVGASLWMVEWAPELVNIVLQQKVPISAGD